MKRTAYLLGGGYRNTIILSWVALVLALVSLLLVVQIGYNTFYGSILDIPCLQLFLPEEAIEEIREGMTNILNEMEEKFGEYEFDEESALIYESTHKVLEKPSLHSIMEFSELTQEGIDRNTFEMMKLIYQITVGVFVFLCVLIVLSALFLSKGLMIFEFILAGAVYYLFGGWIMLAILFVLLIAYCIALSVGYADWKDYKSSLAED